MIELILDDLPDFYLLPGIARGKFTDDADIPDPFGAETVPHAGRLYPIDAGDFHAAVIDVAGHETGILLDVIQGRRKTGAADEQHSHPVDLVLDDGICGNGGAEDDPFQLMDGGFIDQFVGNREKRGQKVLFVRENFGLFQNREVIDQNRIRMCAAHINTQDHDAASPLELTIYIMIKLS